MTTNKRHRLYGTWSTMRSRCNNPNFPKYENYGARGITVDPRWDDFRQFVEDMGERPEGHTLDRIDNDGNYTPDNCRWATHKEQAANRRLREDAIMLTKGSATKSIAEWADDLGMNLGTLYGRHRKGWSDEKILQPLIAASEAVKTRKPKHSDPVFAAFGESLTAAQWSKKTGIARQTIAARIRRGWPVEKAVS